MEPERLDFKDEFSYLDNVFFLGSMLDKKTVCRLPSHGVETWLPLAAVFVMCPGSIAEIKNFRGFVPQDDIVHEHLTVRLLVVELRTYFSAFSRVDGYQVPSGNDDPHN